MKCDYNDLKRGERFSPLFADIYALTGANVPAQHPKGPISLSTSMP
jgi:hypothetical protein